MIYAPRYICMSLDMEEQEDKGRISDGETAAKNC